MNSECDLQRLVLSSGNEPTGGVPLCLFMVHNEINILPQFFAHYRAFGPIQFVVIDDRSTDGCGDYLAAQADVSLFVPRPGSTYREHKQQWRSELLDRFGTGRWCLAPDADEQLIWKNFERRDFRQLLLDIDAEKAEGMAATMVDMYCARPIAEHLSSGRSLLDDFPLFDDPLIDPLAYQLRLPGTSFSRKYPTPAMITTGGMRDRVLAKGRDSESTLARLLLRNSIRKNHSPKGLSYLRERLIYLLTRRSSKLTPLNMTKLPLLRWRAGGKFNGGAHHLNLPLTLASERGVLMHFPFTRGRQGAMYTAGRAQHANGAIYYDLVSEYEQVSPVYSGTSHYQGSDSFRGFY